MGYRFKTVHKLQVKSAFKNHYLARKYNTFFCQCKDNRIWFRSFLLWVLALVLPFFGQELVEYLRCR